MLRPLSRAYKCREVCLAFSWRMTVRGRTGRFMCQAWASCGTTIWSWRPKGIYHFAGSGKIKHAHTRKYLIGLRSGYPWHILWWHEGAVVLKWTHCILRQLCQWDTFLVSISQLNVGLRAERILPVIPLSLTIFSLSPGTAIHWLASGQLSSYTTNRTPWPHLPESGVSAKDACLECFVPEYSIFIHSHSFHTLIHMSVIS